MKRAICGTSNESKDVFNNRIKSHELSPNSKSDFSPESKFTLKHARTVDNHTFTDDKLTSHDQIPNYILKMLMMANYHAREFTLNLNKDKDCNKFKDDSDDGDSDNECECEEEINPMDALLGTFHCSDNFLRRDLAVKLSACQLSVPFIFPDPAMPTKCMTVFLSALEKIKKSWRDASSNNAAKEVYATEHPFPIVSFIRLGNVTMSKSSLMNKIISDSNGDHEFFFHKDMKGGSVKRKVVDGLVELVWYLPGGSDENTLKNEICFANLRGDVQIFKKQFNILREISNTFCILLPSEMPDYTTIDFLNEMMQFKGKIILIFSEKRQEQAKEYYNDLKKQHSTKLSIVAKSLNMYKFCQSIRQALQKSIQNQIKEAEMKSLVKLRLCSKESDVYFDDDLVNAKLGKTMETWLSKGVEETKNLFKLQLHVPALADLERKIHNPKFHSINDDTTKKNDLKEIHEDLAKEKEDQKKSCKMMSEEVRPFLESFAKMNEHELNRNLHRLKYLLDKESLSVMAKFHEQYHQALVSLQKNSGNTCDHKQDSKSRDEKKLIELQLAMSKSSFGLEHVIRELAQLYQLLDALRTNYACAAANILLSGEPLELLDGDSGYLPLEWFNAVYKNLEDKTNNSRIYVISVLGIQSSGKSTMLNTMFGLEFPVSAGRCTRGAFASLIPVSEQLKCDSNCDYILIIDTEGLKGMADPKVREHDNELATFAIGIADVTIVNIFGENHNEMKELLSIAVHAFLKMKLVKEKKSCKIVHQNVAATDAKKKLMMDRRNLKQDLDKMAKLAAAQENCEDQFQKLDDIIAFDENEDVFYIPSYLKGSPPMAPINPNYGKALQIVKEKIVKEMCSKRMVNFTLSSFTNRVKSLWEAMLKENFIFSFRNVIEVRAYTSLDKKLFEESVKLMVNGMAEIEKSIQRDLKRCTTSNERRSCWMSCQTDISKKAEDIKIEMEEAMNMFFESSEDKSTIEPWKDEVMVKIERYKKNQVMSVMASCEATFDQLQEEQDVEEKIISYEKRLLCRAKKLASVQSKNDVVKCKAEFEKEWEKWISEVPVCKKQENDVNKCMLSVLLSEISDLKAQMVTKLKPVTYQIVYFFKADPIIDESMLAFPTNFESADKSEAVLFANSIKNKAILLGQQFQENISKRAFRISKNDLIQMYSEILSTIEKATEKLCFKFKKSLICDTLLYSFALAYPIFYEMEKCYIEKRDIRQSIENNLRQDLEAYFLNLCKEMEEEVLVATSLVNVLRKPIFSELHKAMATAVTAELLTKDMFQSKAHFHASVLIQLGEKGRFEFFIPYLKNPIQFLKNKLKEYVEDFCLNTNSSLMRLLLKRQGEKLKSNIFFAIDVANQQAIEELKQGSAKWKVTNWIKRFVKECTSLAITKNMFGVASLDEDIKETDLFDTKVRELLTNAFETLINSEVDRKIINNWQPALHETLFKSMFGCQAVCPLCNALCDNTMDHSNFLDNDPNLTSLPKHSTRIHRPQGLKGRKYVHSKILDCEICTFDVAGEGRFRNTETNGEWCKYKDYQSVNDYYKSWTIPPDPSFKASKYWQWFMVKFSKELAEHYKAKEPNIPKVWKKISFEEAKEQLQLEFNL